MDKKLYMGDISKIIENITDNSIDALITDPPYGLSNHPKEIIEKVLREWLNGNNSYIPELKGFMGKKWDRFVPPPVIWEKIYRTLKPGAHTLVFASNRTVDLMTMSLRLANFEIRDTIVWLYGSGMPKGLNISKALDSYLLNGKSNSRNLRKTEQEYGEDEYILKGRNNGLMGEKRTYRRKHLSPQNPIAKEYEGFYTLLKPAVEFIILARKPIEEGTTIAENIIKYGTGGLNLKEAREYHQKYIKYKSRFPANVILEDSEEVLSLFPYTKSGNKKALTKEKLEQLGIEYKKTNGIYGRYKAVEEPPIKGDEGGAYRFFYCAKASRNERTHKGKIENNHLTVKPVDLMKYLIILLTKEGQVVFDPFMGSGTTGVAASMLNRKFIGVEQNKEYFEIAQARMQDLGFL